MTATPPPIPAAPSRGWRTTLILSLALNLLLVFLILGAVWRGGWDGDGPRRPGEMALGPFAEALDRADRRAILGELRDERGIRGPSRDERRAAFGPVLDAVRADPFDPDAAAAALDGLTARGREAEAAFRDALVARLGTMDAAARASFADRLAEALDRPDRRRD